MPGCLLDFLQPFGLRGDTAELAVDAKSAGCDQTKSEPEHPQQRPREGIARGNLLKIHRHWHTCSGCRREGGRCRQEQSRAEQGGAKSALHGLKW